MKRNYIMLFAIIFCFFTNNNYFFCYPLVSDQKEEESKPDMEAVKKSINEYNESQEKFFNQTYMTTYTEPVDNSNKIKKLVYETSLQFSLQFSLAKSMSDVANNMEILNADEQNKIENLTNQTEKIFNTFSDWVSGITGAASIYTMLFLPQKDVSKDLFIGLNVGALIPQAIKIFIKNNKEIDSAFSYAHDKATRISINAFLSIQMRSISKSLIELENNTMAIKEGINKQNTEDSIALYANNFISFLDATDRFYTVDLLNLKNAISERGGFNIYTPELSKKLDDLSGSIGNNISLWRESRIIWDEDIKILKEYILSIDNKK